jgi:hypothetical protein
VTLNQQNLGFMVSAALIPTAVTRLGLRVQGLRKSVTPFGKIGMGVDRQIQLGKRGKDGELGTGVDGQIQPGKLGKDGKLGTG